MPTATTFLKNLLDPHVAALHLSWALLVLAMLMRSLTWLRTLAIVAALVAVVVGAVIVYNPVSVVWGVALALVNLLQLVIGWWGRRHPDITGDERLLVERLVPELKRNKAERVLDRVEWREAEFGEQLVAAGQPVGELMLVLDGAARVEHEGRIVGIVSRGDFIDETSFLSGGAAPVAIIADRPMKLACLSREELHDLAARDKALRRALDARFGLDFSTGGTVSPPAAPPRPVEPAL